MILESTDFNVDHWSRFTEVEFIEQCVKDGIFKDYSDQIALLKVAYQLLTDDNP